MTSSARYATGWTDPRSLWGHAVQWVRYGDEYEYMPISGFFMKKKKVDAHEYVTDAKNMSIEECQNLFIVCYGDAPIEAITFIPEQTELMWEVSNKLYWAGLLVHDPKMDTYTCKS